MKKLRIGFLSTASIGRKNWKAIFNSGNCVVAAVASRDVEQSRKFIRECQARSFRSPTMPARSAATRNCSRRRNVDAVYIPLPTGLRKEWVLRAAAAGKHVLCEKPCGVSAADLEEMTCRLPEKPRAIHGRRDVHAQPAPARASAKFWTTAKASARSGASPRRSVFSARREFFRDNIRVNGALEPAGCLGDLGWYCIRFALWTMNWQLPRTVTGRILSQSGPADRPPAAPTEFSGELFFDGGVSAEFYCSFLAAKPAMGSRQRPERLAAAAGFRPSVRQLRTGLRGQRTKFASPAAGGVKCPPGRRPAELGHRDRAGHADVPQLREPDFFRQAERRLADVGAENATSSGRVS